MGFPIGFIPHTFSNLEKHLAYTDKPSAVYLEIELFPQDKEHLQFVATHTHEINTLIAKYSALDVRLMPIDPSAFIAIDTFGIYCSFDFHQRKIIIRKSNMTPLRKFLLDYLTHHELLQICVHIHNKY